MEAATGKSGYVKQRLPNSSLPGGRVRIVTPADRIRRRDSRPDRRSRLWPALDERTVQQGLAFGDRTGASSLFCLGDATTVTWSDAKIPSSIIIRSVLHICIIIAIPLVDSNMVGEMHPAPKIGASRVPPRCFNTTIWKWPPSDR